MHSTCHASIFAFWSAVRLSAAKLTHDIDAVFAAPFAQQALPPANALDAISVATATRTAAVILIMVSAQTGAMQEPFNCIRRSRAVTFGSPTASARAGDC